MQSGGAAALHRALRNWGSPFSSCRRQGGRWLSSKPSVLRERPFAEVFDSGWIGIHRHLSCKFPNIFSTAAAIISETNDLIAIIPLDELAAE